VAHLLEIRVLLAPAYTRQAMEAAASEIADLLNQFAELDDTSGAFAAADWQLHHLLTLRAANPIFRLLLNSFQSLYQVMGEHYFVSQESRERSRSYYAELLNCARRNAYLKAETLTRDVMNESIALWKKSS
jgi:GntR family negative regulator for fad regulon and positive regulator of fabA